MFRKLLFGAIAALGLLSPLAIPTGAQAREFHHEHRHLYRVFYRDVCRPNWVFAGRFVDYRAAQHFAEQFRCRGFVTSIRS